MRSLGASRSLAETSKNSWARSQGAKGWARSQGAMLTMLLMQLDKLLAVHPRQA